MPGEKEKPDKGFTLSHIGILNAARNPKTLWKVLGEICSQNESFRSDLKIQLIGKTDFSVLEEIDKNGLSSNLEKTEYLSHNEAIAKQQTSQILLLLINNSANAKGILTGKFFEYLAAGRPILAVGPADGEVANVLEETQAGVIVGFEDEEKTSKVVLEYYSQYKNGELSVSTKSIEKFSRRELTKQLSEVLNQL